MSRKEFFESLKAGGDLASVINRQVVPEMLLELNQIKRINLDILPVIGEDVESLKNQVSQLRLELAVLKNEIVIIKSQIEDCRDTSAQLREKNIMIESLDADVRKLFINHKTLESNVRKILNKKLSIQLCEEEGTVD